MRQRLAVILLAALALAAGTFAARTLADPPSLGWDEGGHLDGALEAYAVLTTGTLKDLLLYLDAPRYYPFVHDLLIAATWRVVGVNELGARLPAALMWLLMIPATALLAARVAEPRTRTSAAVLAALLAVTSREVLMQQSRVMLDLTATVAATLTVIAYLRWLEAASWRRAGCTVLGLLVCFFSKYYVGIVLGLAMTLHGAVADIGFRRFRQATVLLAGPALLWLYQDPTKKLSLLLETGYYARFTDTGELPGLGAVVMVVRDHAAFWPVGVVVFALYLASFARGIRQPRGILLIFPLLQLVAIGASPNQQARYILPAMPVLQVAAAALLAGWIDGARWRGRLVALAAVAVTLPLLMPPSRMLSGDPLMRERAALIGLRSWIDQRSAERPLVLVGATNELAPSIGRFAGVRREIERTGRFDRDAAPTLVACPPAYTHTSRLEPLPRSESIKVVEESFRQYAEGYGSPVPVLVIDLDPDSVLRNDDYVHRNQWQEVVAGLVEASGSPIVATHELPDVGLRARVFAVSAPE